MVNVKNVLENLFCAYCADWSNDSLPQRGKGDRFSGG